MRSLSGLACVLLTIASAWSQTAATGSMMATCGFGASLRLDLTLPGNKTVIFSIEPRAVEHMVNTPVFANAYWCSAPNQCENATATIVFKQFKINRKASGTFTVQFKDARKETGAFRVMRKKQEKPLICE